MRHSQTAVLERGYSFDSEFTTEPYEAPWASEARFFVQALNIDEDARVELQMQISPDGLQWCDAENVEPVTLSGAMVSWSARDFGGWLRLRGRVGGESARLRIYLICKE